MGGGEPETNAKSTFSLLQSKWVKTDDSLDRAREPQSDRRWEEEEEEEEEADLKG